MHLNGIINMAELYNNIRAINSSYVPKFIGSNFNEISNAAERLDKRYRDNVDYLDKVSIALSQEPYLKGDEHIRDKHINNIKQKFDEIASSPENFENSTSAVNILAKGVLMDQDRLYALDNAAKAQQYNDLKLKLGPKFISYGDHPDTFSTIDPTTGERKKFNLDVEENLDKNKKFKELIGNIARDGYYVSPKGEKIEISKDLPLLTALKTGQVQDAVTMQKINNLVEGLLPLYLQETEGQQHVKMLSSPNTFNNNNPLSRTLIPIEESINGKKQLRWADPVEERIRQEFRAAAYPQVGQNVTAHYQVLSPDDLLGKDYGKNQNDNFVYTPTTSTAPKVNSDDKELVSAKDPNVWQDKKTGKWYKGKGNNNGLFVNTPNGKVPISPLFNYANPKDLLNQNLFHSTLEEVPNPSVNSPGTVSYQYNHLLNNLSSEELKQYGINSLNEFEKQYDLAKTKNKSISVMGQNLDKELIDDYETQFKRGNFPVYLADQSEPVSLEQSGVEYDDKGEPKIQIVNIVPSVPGMKSGGAEVKLLHKGSAPTKAFIPLNDAFTQQTQFAHRIGQLSQYASQDIHEDENGNPINTIDHPVIDANNGRRDEDGNEYYNIIYTTTIPTPNKQNPFTTIVHRGVRVKSGNNTNDLWGKDASEFLNEDFSNIDYNDYLHKSYLLAKSRLSKGRTIGETIRKGK